VHSKSFFVRSSRFKEFGESDRVVLNNFGEECQMLRNILVFGVAALLLSLLHAGCGGDADEFDDTGAGPEVVFDASPEFIGELPGDLPEEEMPVDLAGRTDVGPELVDAEDLAHDIPLLDVPPETVDLAQPDIVIDVDPGQEFERFCGEQEWDENAGEATVGELNGTFVGVYNAFPEWTLEMMKVIPDHPFWVKKIRVAFGGGAGKGLIRLTPTFGRSYPGGGGYPDIKKPENNLMEPAELDLDNPNPDEWIEINVAAQGIFLEPTQHYAIVYQHYDTAPYLAIESLPEGEISRGLIVVPAQFEPYGIDGNYRMELAGSYFCAWDDETRWFGEDASLPFVQDGASRPTVSDLNSDGHDDIVVFKNGPYALLGNGEGDFAPPDYEVFPEGLKANMVVLGDLDNDGDPDAFMSTWVGVDGDADGITINDGDCNDKDAEVYPGADEVPDNGLDDDCDGTADDGADESDGDADGWTIKEGDCDDTQDTVHPEAEELLDGRDNDCDLQVDEDFPNTVWLNNGTDGFAPVAEAGVETLDPTGAAALGDGNGDGILDTYWGNWLEHYPDPASVADRYAVGHGDGTFTDITEEVGMLPEEFKPCYGVTWVDYNNDGQQDVWVGNYQLNPNFFYHNNGDGTFVNLAEELNLKQDDVGGWAGHSYGGDWGDFDNDGDMDLFVPNLAHPRTMPYSDPSRFMVNQGEPDYDFVDKREALGFIYDEGDVNSAFGDFDNDMDLDIVVIALYQNHYSKFYRNDGDDGFVDITYETHTAVHDSIGAVWSDVDEDGDLDLFISDRHGTQRAQLFLNRVGQDNNWIELILEGTSTNRDGVGARVTLEAGGVSQIREVKGGGRHSNAQDSRVVHFGLAQETVIDKVAVRWVGGETETIIGAQINMRQKVVEGSGEALPVE